MASLGLKKGVVMYVHAFQHWICVLAVFMRVGDKASLAYIHCTTCWSNASMLYIEFLHSLMLCVLQGMPRDVVYVCMYAYLVVVKAIFSGQALQAPEML